MRLVLDYGTDGLEVDLPDTRVTVIEPVFRPAVADPHATLLRAIRSPLQSAPLGELAPAGRRVAISVCDITRAQPRREMLLALFEEMPLVPAEDMGHHGKVESGKVEEMTLKVLGTTSSLTFSPFHFSTFPLFHLI